ncbi:MAG: tetratricopeptide repeat protein [Candidatus Acidiferrales bacterium]
MDLKFFRWIPLGLLGLLFLPPCFSLRAESEPAGRARPSQAAPASREAMSAEDLEIEKAKIFMAEKKYDEAIRTYQDVLKGDRKNAMVLNMVGIAYLNVGNFGQAKKYFQRSEKADKKFSSPVNNLGMVYYHQKNFRRAIREYKKAVAIDPELAGAHANLGFAYYNSNHLAEAATEFQKAIELDPQVFEHNDRVGTTVEDRTVANHGLFFFTMARVYAQKNDAAHCAEYLRKSLDEGYKGVQKSRTDPAFKTVLKDPAVQAVLLLAAPAEGKAAAGRPGA